MIEALLAITLPATQGLVTPAPAEPQAPPSLRRVDPVTVINSDEIVLDGIGDCVTRDGREIDLRRVMYLDNGRLTFDAPGGPFRAYVQNETLLIDRLGARDAVLDTYFIRIDYQVAADGGGNLDLQIQLASVEGRLAVYWRETYRNRGYHQGLYTISGQSLTFLCAGRGGIRTED